MPVCLVPLENGGSPIVLDKAIILVGRHPDCDLVLSQSRKISRKHCCLAQVNDSLMVRDLGSTNGVWVNGDRIRREQRLRLGDEVAFGDVPFRLEDQSLKAKKRAKRRPDEEAEELEGWQDNQPVSQRLDLSQDVPIPIPDEGQSFAVEASADDLPRPVLEPDDSDDGIICLTEDDGDDDLGFEDGIYLEDDAFPEE
jgi:pSer/pThr/pTyr-binding forkhead associated (FHA) protein